MAFFFLSISLVAIPFCLGFGFFPFTPNMVVDYRVAKDLFAFSFAIFIFFWTITSEGIPKQKNHWPVLLLVYLVLHQYLVPKLDFDSQSDKLVCLLWSFRPLYYCFVYYLFYLACQQIFILEEYRRTTLKILMWVGFISAIYLICQFFKIDPYQHLNGATDTPGTKAATLTSFFTHPNYAASFIGLCLPFALLNKNYGKVLVMLAAICMAQSYVVITAMVLGLTFYLWHVTRYKKTLVILTTLSVMVFIGLLYVTRHHTPDHGRFNVWILMIQELHSSFIFGFGLGSFPILFELTHHLHFEQAHSEPLQFVYETGIVGGFLLLKGVWSHLKPVVFLIEKDEIYLAVTTSFVIILVCSLGQFIWQIEPHRYISVMLMGMIIASTNQRRIGV